MSMGCGDDVRPRVILRWDLHWCSVGKNCQTCTNGTPWNCTMRAKMMHGDKWTRQQLVPHVSMRNNQSGPDGGIAGLSKNIFFAQDVFDPDFQNSTVCSSFRCFVVR